MKKTMLIITFLVILILGMLAINHLNNISKSGEEESMDTTRLTTQTTTPLSEEKEHFSLELPTLTGSEDVCFFGS